MSIMAQFADGTSNRDYHNISLIGRRRAGMTQEEWAEALGVSVRSVGDYEAGRALPSDATVVKMAEVAKLDAICYWHMRQALGYASDILPEVEVLDLGQAVVCLLKELRDLDKRDVVGQLLDMADDGIIDANEEENFQRICAELRDVIQAVLLLLAADKHGEAIR